MKQPFEELNDIWSQKICKSCQRLLPLEMFGRYTDRHDDHPLYCRDCKADMDRRYRESPKGRAAKRRKDANERQTENYKLRRKAYAAVHKTINAGELTKASDHPCAKCGEPAVHWHHHNGYEEAHWLDVVALCARCHKGAEGS